MDMQIATDHLDNPRWDLALDAAFRMRPRMELSHAARTRAMAAMTAMRGWEAETTWTSPWAIAAMVLLVGIGGLAVGVNQGWIGLHLGGLSLALKSGLLGGSLGKTVVYAVGAGLIAIGAVWFTTQQETV